MISGKLFSRVVHFSFSERWLRSGNWTLLVGHSIGMGSCVAKKSLAVLSDEAERNSDLAGEITKLLAIKKSKPMMP